MHEPQNTPTLFDASTSEEARRVASAKAGDRYVQIVKILAAGPKCIFEIAAEIGCFDHQISGRFGEMVELGLIRKTGERTIKPSTGCKADVYEIVGEVDSLGNGG